MAENMGQEMRDFVESALRRAGHVLLRHFRTPALVIEAKGVGDLVTEADRASETYLVAAIRERFPEHGIISEEMGEVRPNADNPWLLDPLEATYNFSRGLPMWGINLALQIENRVRIGAFFDPLLDEMYYAEQTAGVIRNGQPIRSSGLEELHDAAVYCSTRRHVDLFTGSVRKFRHIGSIGNALAYVAAGHLDAALEVGGGPWDYAAGALPPSRPCRRCPRRSDVALVHSRLQLANHVGTARARALQGHLSPRPAGASDHPCPHERKRDPYNSHSEPRAFRGPSAGLPARAYAW